MIIDFLQNLSPQLATFLLAMLPLTELRASIPIALEIFNLSIWEAFFYSVLGDIIPAILIVFLIGPFSEKFSKKYNIFDKFFKWLFKRTRKRFRDSYATWGKIALILFVAIPLPVTGAWTGAVAAWLFGIEKKEAIVYIILGVIMAGVLVTLLSLGFLNIFNT